MPPESIDAHFTYPELRDLDDALDRLYAASRAVDDRSSARRPRITDRPPYES